MVAKKKTATKTYTRDDLDGMTKDELQSIAEKRGLEVARGDGEPGDPLKDDYVNALALTSGNASAGDGETGLDETVPGGHYIKNDGTHVNAEGKPLDKHGNAAEKEEE